MHSARLVRLGAIVTALATSAACFPVHTPVGTSLYAGTRHDTLVVLLPGFGAHDTTFEKQGVIDALRASGVDADLVAVDANYGYYVKEQLIPRLREDVWPMTRAYEHVWVMGISMGGLGTLLTAREFGDDVEGIVLLSPFLGRGRTLDEVQAGPLRDYVPPADPAWDASLWGYFKQLDGDADKLPVVLLGHGDKDLGVKNHDWLAAYVPADHVRVVSGGHTWKTWRELAGLFGREVLPAYAAFGGASLPAVATTPQAADTEAATESSN